MFKPLNDLVAITPIEKEKEQNGIILLKNTDTHRRGVVYSVCDDEKWLEVGDRVVYTDTFKTIDVDGVTLHLVEKSGVYFKEI